jgi:hypothetical protein
MNEQQIDLLPSAIPISVRGWIQICGQQAEMQQRPAGLQ